MEGDGGGGALKYECDLHRDRFYCRSAGPRRTGTSDIGVFEAEKWGSLGDKHYEMGEVVRGFGDTKKWVFCWDCHDCIEGLVLSITSQAK